MATAQIRLPDASLAMSRAASMSMPSSAASASEIRTPALWGLRLRRPLLHDGSAATISDAVERHGAEAALARRGYAQLSSGDRERLLTFLRSL